MLNLEYLLDEAKNNGLPILKRRAIVREYIQIIILGNIYRHHLGKTIFFTGGTSLRYFYKMPRFSEDLDFDTNELTADGFDELLEAAKKGLMKEGFSVHIKPKTAGKIFSAALYFDDLMKLYRINDARSSDLMVKLEIYKPGWIMDTVSDVLSLYGYNFSAVLLRQDNVISEKLCALLRRGRGRDIYDLLFMLKRRYPFNNKLLKANNVEGPPKELVLEHLDKLTQAELKALAKQIQPFLFNEEDVELVLKAPLYAKKFLIEYPILT